LASLRLLAYPQIRLHDSEPRVCDWRTVRAKDKKDEAPISRVVQAVAILQAQRHKHRALKILGEDSRALTEPLFARIIVNLKVSAAFEDSLL
jgi:phosphoglucomutase